MAHDVPVIIVYSLAEAVAALRAAARTRRRVVVGSAPEAGIYAGPGWFRGVIEAAREAVPDAQFTAFLDCGDEPGAALAAIRDEVESVVFTGRADVACRLADIAGQHGVRFITKRPAGALDLGDDFFATSAAIERRCADYLRPLAPPDPLSR